MPTNIATEQGIELVFLTEGGDFLITETEEYVPRQKIANMATHRVLTPDDLIASIEVSDKSASPRGTNKHISLQQLVDYVKTALSTS